METTITEYLERTMESCSLSDQTSTSIGDGFGMSDEHIPISDRFLEFSSNISFPSHLEQCLDLKTGEIYYRNWNKGLRVKEDPRKVVSRNNNAEKGSGESNGSMFSEEDNSYCATEESSSESSPSSRENRKEDEEEDILVVAGCKACLMYYMVPKLLKDCPKCAAHLLHFDQPHSA